MKREHKYRAWDKVKKKMFPVYEIQWDYREVMFFNDNTDFSLEDSANFSFDFATFDDCELLEWTGLKDNNGKDIYDGDIMMCYHDDYYDDGSDRFVTVIEFMDGSFWSINEDCCSPDDCEVIGNIYENPELLQTV